MFNFAPVSLGSNLRTARLAQNLTLEQLAEKSDVDVGTISALENRGSQRSKYAPALASALGMSLEALSAGSATGGSVAREKKAKVAGSVRSHHRVAEPPGNYLPAWPFPDIKPAVYDDLTDLQKAEVQGFVKSLLRQKRNAA